jgi:hypothetical protein
MLATLAKAIQRAVAALPGWVLLGAGLTLLGLAVLVPAWVDSRALQWQVGLMREQARLLGEQERDYKQFQDALAKDDPVLLERLAFYHLRLKPAGSDPLALVRPGSPPGPARVSQRGTTASGLSAPAALPPIKAPSIEEMLNRPLPSPGPDYPPFEPERSRLVRLTRGISQIAMAAAGMFCVAAGLLAGSGPRKRPAAPEVAATPPAAMKRPTAPAIRQHGGFTSHDPSSRGAADLSRPHA